MRPRLDPVDPTDPLRDPTSSEYKALQDPRLRDREVRQHEQAHVAAGGTSVTGGPTYSDTRGPDGRRYAVGGEGQIDSAPVADDPAATIRKMQVRSAALAPAEPSAHTENRARADLREQQNVERASDEEDGPPSAQDALRAYRGAVVDEPSSPSLDLIA